MSGSSLPDASAEFLLDLQWGASGHVVAVVGAVLVVVDEPGLQQTAAAMKRDLELWYRRYVDPDVDGSKEGVTGLGQLCRAGLFANRAKVYHTDRYKEKQP